MELSEHCSDAAALGKAIKLCLTKYVCSLLAADSSSSSPNVVVCCLFVVCLLFVVYQVEKLLANCYLTAT